MRIISDDDLRTFTDPNGDQLITLRKARKKDWDDYMALVMRYVEAGDPTNPKSVKFKDGFNPAELTRFMFQRVARKMIINGTEYTGDAMLKIYEQLDPESAEWVDKCIAEVWERPDEKNL
jgi:hypothetical protein